ncbi:MAG: CDP-alcohol phosphatidyltransferase family protein [Oscillospiraceae bacterium]|nr:CDP-alcohol phosphatidyltransferase family protein [Oscillospiraceae bacterium]
MILDISEIEETVKKGQERSILLGFYDYTVILTYVGMLFAFMGILLSINENFKGAVICLMTAGFCDMFDGTIASTKKRTKNQKRFGIQIDSLSDLISFGILPAVFVYMFSGKNTLSAIVTAIYTLFALIRLSFFNVMEEERQDSTSGKRKEYLGVPVTTVSLLLPLVYILYITNLLSNTIFLLLALLLLGHLFIIAVRIVKPQKTGKIIMLLFGIIEAVGVFML